MQDTQSRAIVEEGEESSPPLKRETWKEANWTFIFSRLTLLLISFIAVSRLPGQQTRFWPQQVKTPPLNCIHQVNDCLKVWWQWDVQHYVTIAQEGYKQTYHTAFFPLWPLTMRLLGNLYGHSLTDYYIAGLLLSNIFFFVSLVLFYRLVCREHDATVAKNAIFYLAFCPYAIIFFIPYTESLFLLLCIALFFFLQRDGMINWWLAGLCGYFAALTRATGIVLVVPFLVVFLQHFWPYRAKLRQYWLPALNALLPIVLIPAGLLTYMVYLGITKHNPLSFSTEQVANWGRTLELPWVGIWESLQVIFFSTHQNIYDIFELVFTLIPLAALIAGWKRLSLRYSLFALCMILFSLSNPYKPSAPLFEAPRYMFIAFPIFILFALWSKNARLERTFTIISLTSCALLTVLWVTGNAI